VTLCIGSIDHKRRRLEGAKEKVSTERERERERESFSRANFSSELRAYTAVGRGKRSRVRSSSRVGEDRTAANIAIATRAVSIE